MIRTQISFDKPLYERAKRVAKKRGISLAELCRSSVAQVVAQEDSSLPWMRYAGAVEGARDDSQSLDEVVYSREAP